MRVLLIALLAAISYAQTEWYLITETATGAICSQYSLSEDCPGWDTVYPTSVQGSCNAGTYPAVCTDDATRGQSTQGYCGTMDTDHYATSCSDCTSSGCEQRGSGTITTLTETTSTATTSTASSASSATTSTASESTTTSTTSASTTTTLPGFPTAKPTMGRNFALGSEDEGVDAYWIIACMLMVMFCCQMIFFAWCCYTDAQNKRAKPDTYNIEMGNAPKKSAPVMITGPAEGNGVDPVNISLEKVPSTSVGGMDIVKSISPSVSTYQVADGTLPGSFYNAETAPSAPEANLGDSLKIKPDSPQTGGASVQTPKKGGMAEEIRKLKALVDEGVISEEEFQSGKAKLLGTSSQNSDI